MLKKMVGENEKLTVKSKVDLSRLPPCHDNLVPHLQRVNHRLANYKRADQAIFWRPNPFDEQQGWEKNKEGFLEPVWSCGPILPTSLVDLLQSFDDEESDDEEDYSTEYEECSSDDDE